MLQNTSSTRKSLMPLLQIFNHRGNNSDVLVSEEKMKLIKGMNEIIHYYLINNRKKPEKNVRFNLVFPDCIKISYNPGKLETTEGTRRMEFFYPVFHDNEIMLFWPSFPPETKILFEIRIQIPDHVDTETGDLYLSVSSDNIIGKSTQKIEIEFV